MRWSHVPPKVGRREMQHLGCFEGAGKQCAPHSSDRHNDNISLEPQERNYALVFTP